MKKKKMGWAFGFIILGIFALMVIAVVVTVLILLWPKNTYVRFVDKVYLETNNKIKEFSTFNPLATNVNYNYKVSIDTNDSELSNYINGEYSLKSNVDLSKKYLYLNGKIKIDNDTIEVNGVSKKDKTFVELKDVTDGYLLLPFSLNDYYEEISKLNLSEENLTKVNKLINEELKNNYNKDNMSSTYEKITINDKTQYVKKYTYIINESDLKDLYGNLKNNDELIETLKDITNLKTKEIKEMFDSENIDLEKPIELNIYTSLLMKNIIRVELVGNDSTIRYTNFKDTNYELYYKDDNTSYQINLDKNKDNTIFKVTNNKGDEVFKIKFSTFDKTEYVGKYTISYNEEKITGTIEYKIDKNNNEKKAGSIKLTCDIDDVYYKIKLDYELNKDDYDKVEVKKYQDVNKLTDKELDKMEKRLEKKLNKFKLFESLPR